MKRFLIQVLLFCFITTSLFLVFLSQADGCTDPFYIRFTTPQQENLILGTSRAAQGLQPAVFDSINELKIFNYAFTVGHSPYGGVYLNSVKKKLDNSTKNGVFIITVSPWSISSKSSDPNDSRQFRERSRSLGKTAFVNHKPNFFYLINNLKGKYPDVLNSNTPMFLHNSGWLEVTVTMDPVEVEARTHKIIRSYREDNLPVFQYSKVRYDYLQKTIEFLSKHGDVYLVRLPISSRMMEIEAELMPDFEGKMDQLTTLTKGYLDLTVHNDQYQYTDGNHLYKDSGKLVSIKIAEWIQKLRSQIHKRVESSSIDR